MERNGIIKQNHINMRTYITNTIIFIYYNIKFVYRKPKFGKHFCVMRVRL